jgi:hypothetical protein
VLTPHSTVWLIPQALAPSYGVMIMSRVFCGLSQAGGSVTLGMGELRSFSSLCCPPLILLSSLLAVADMWEPEDQQYAMNFVVLVRPFVISRTSHIHLKAFP